MRTTWWMALALVAGTIAATMTARAGEELNVGDPAPKLEVKEFVKGDPVAALEKGKIYVVEFWATWCGPCIQTIPHLTELQKKHPEVTFIGVSVWERDSSKVPKFVEKMGDKMDYRVATDAVPDGGKGDEGAMAKNWMTAAAQDGIPAAFIINADGVVAWIGHPKQMDGPLAEVVAGKYDVKAAAAKYKQEKARERKLQAIFAKIQKAQENGDAKGALAAIDEAIQESPEMEEPLGAIKFEQLVELKQTDKALAYGRKLIEGFYKDDSEGLNNIAYPLVDPDRDAKAEAKLIAFAVEVAEKACALTNNEDANILDTLACALFAQGETDKAIEVQEKALKLDPRNEELKEHMKLFKAAKKKE